MNREKFMKLLEARMLIEDLRREYNQIRPSIACVYYPPAPLARQTPIMDICKPASLTLKVVE